MTSSIVALFTKLPITVTDLNISFSTEAGSESLATPTIPTSKAYPHFVHSIAVADNWTEDETHSHNIV